MGVSLALNNVNPVYLYVQGEIISIKDNQNLLGGAMQVGDPVLGAMSYDAAAGDADPLTDLGQYVLTSQESGVKMACGDLVFCSNPSRPDLEITVQNGPTDSFDMQSRNNLQTMPGVVIRNIQVELSDANGTALSNDELNEVKFDLANWPTVRRITIQGTKGLRIEANITSIGEAPVEAEADHPGTNKFRFHD